MNDLIPEHPSDANIRHEVPDESHVEGAEILANQARPTLRAAGFDDDEINEWALTYITEEGSGDVESFIAWIENRENR